MQSEAAFRVDILVCLTLEVKERWYSAYFDTPAAGDAKPKDEP